jgi:flagellar protein FlaJ
MYTYVFTPLLSVVFIYLAHGMQPKTPITDWRPYKIFAISSLVSVFVICLLSGFFGILDIPLLDPLKNIIDFPTAVAISLFISTAPPAIIQGKISRRRLGIERGIASFLRDLTEIRKTGLAPERCIEALSRRDYGAFSEELGTITTQLSWGIPIRRALMGFVKRTKSWLSQIVMFLLMETVDVGGGTIPMIEALARFYTMTQEVEKEKKMSVRPYIFVPYFAAVLLVATTLMTLMFTSQTLAIAETMAIDLDAITMMFTTSVIIHCYLIGIVAGKISEESVSAGFKHSALLVILAIAAAKLVPIIMNP